MGGPFLSLKIYLKENSNPNQVINILIGNVIKDYFIPQSVFFQFEEKGIYSKYKFGVDKDYIKNNAMLPNEEEIELIKLTKLNAPNCGNDVLDLISEKEIMYYGFCTFGSTKTYYGNDLMTDFFFREKLGTNYYKPIVEICARNEDLRKYKGKKLSEHSLSFDFIGSKVLLDDRDGINYKIAAEKNLEILINKTKELIDEFKNVYDYSYCMIEGRGYYNNFDAIRDKFSILPNFKGFDWG